MNALLVVAHPANSSFSHAMASAARDVLVNRSYGCWLHDLYAEGFNPVQPVTESANFQSEDPLIEQHCRELKAADLILVFHPNWWSQPPAILKGWVDRVFRLNTAYCYPEGVGYEGVPTGLLKARQALVFNTSNTPEEREREAFGDPLESLWSKSVFALCGVPDCVRRMFGPMVTSSGSQREKWLSEVRALVADAA
jgi:NAD(P)H dehydrogenase (quinone)